MKSPWARRRHKNLVCLLLTVRGHHDVFAPLIRAVGLEGACLCRNFSSMTRPQRSTRAQALASKKKEEMMPTNNNNNNNNKKGNNLPAAVDPKAATTVKATSAIKYNEELKSLVELKIAELRFELDEKKASFAADMAVLKLKRENEHRAALVRIPDRIRSMTVREYNAQFDCDILEYIEQLHAGQKSAEAAAAPATSSSKGTRGAGGGATGARIPEVPAARRPWAGAQMTPATRKAGR